MLIINILIAVVTISIIATIGFIAYVYQKDKKASIERQQRYLRKAESFRRNNANTNYRRAVVSPDPLPPPMMDAPSLVDTYSVIGRIDPAPSIDPWIGGGGSSGGGGASSSWDAGPSQPDFSNVQSGSSSTASDSSSCSSSD